MELDTGASFPGSHTEARQAPQGVHAGRLEAPRLGFSLPVLTKGGSSVGEMGVDFQGRKGEGERMAPLSVLIIPKEFQERPPGQGGERAKSREPAWIPLGRERKAAWFLRQEALSLLVLIPLMSLSTFFPSAIWFVSSHFLGVCCRIQENGWGWVQPTGIISKQF